MTLLVLAAAWLVGTAIASAGYGHWWPGMLLLGTGGIAVALSHGERARAVLVALAGLALVMGIARYAAALPSGEPSGIAMYNDTDEPVRLAGTVGSRPEERGASRRFVVDVAGVEVGGTWQEETGRVLVTAPLYPAFRYGDIVDLVGVLETPPEFETFDYREYLARRGVYSVARYPEVTLHAHGGAGRIQGVLHDARATLGHALERSLPEPEGALARGILLGLRDSIPADVNESFNAAGISHLIAISGYNVMLVAGAVTGTLTQLMGRQRATLAAMAVVVLYAAFVGGEPPVLRATLMALVMLGATLAGRPRSALTGVTLAGAVLVVWRPLIVDDVSFQLSFAATLGIVVLAGPMREWLLGFLAPRFSGGVAAAVVEHISVTSAASLAVVPIIASSFERLSLIALPANLLAAPAFGLALLGAFLTAFAGAFDDSLARAAGGIAHVPLHYLVVLAEQTSTLPFASVAVSDFGWLEAAMLYVALLALPGTLALATKEVTGPGKPLRLRPAPLFAVTAVAVAFYVWWGALQPVDDHLRVSILDVGQGDAILVESPAGTRILVDGGPSGSAVTQALGKVLPPSERRIDLMVLTHAQDDHVTGLVEVMERYEVGAVLWNGRAAETGAFRAWTDAIMEGAIPVEVAEAGQVIDVGGGAHVEVLHPQPEHLTGTEDDHNNNAVVLRVMYGGVSFLLTGDIEADAEAAILNAGHDVSSTVLKVAHHGSDGASTAAFLDAVGPGFAVVSAGEDNAFGHPSPTLRLRLAGVSLLRTDFNGTVVFETDGERLWLDYERGKASILDPSFAP